jgi:hypothetical protein
LTPHEKQKRIMIETHRKKKKRERKRTKKKKKSSRYFDFEKKS